MYTFNISQDDYQLLLDIANTEPKVDIFKTTDWIKQNGSTVTLHFASFDSFDEFMMYVDMFESSAGLDDSQENLTATGVRLQNIYDAAYEAKADDE